MAFFNPFRGAVDSQDILEHVSDAVSVVDRQWRVVYVNTAFERLVGRPRKQMLGLTCWQLAPKAVGTIFEKQLQMAMTQQVPVQFEAFYEPLIVWLDVRAFPAARHLTLFFRDITNRKHTEELLDRREQEFRTLVENSPDIIARVDKNLRHLYINAAVQQIRGSHPDQLIGKCYRELDLPEDFRRLFETKITEVFQTSKEVAFEFTDLADHGRIFHVRVVPEFNSDGQVETVMGISRDITLLRQAEQAIRRSESNLQAIFQVASVGMAQAEWATGRFIRVNQKYCQITGYSEQELLAMHYYDLDHPDDKARSSGEYQSVIKGRQDSFNFEKRYVRKDGQTIWIHLNGTVIHDGPGQPLGTLAVIQDITDRKETEKQLNESEQRYRSLFEYNLDAVVCLDNVGRFIAANAAAQKLLGYSLDEILRMDFRAICAPESLEPAVRNFQNELNGISEDLRLTAIARDGRRVELFTTGGPLKVDGRIVGVFVIARQITPTHPVP